MPYGQPADTDPDAWYRAAWRIDEAHLANKAFQSVLCSAPSAPLKTTFIRLPSLSIARLFSILPLLVTQKPPPPSLSIEVPMNINMTRKTRFLPPQEYY